MVRFTIPGSLGVYESPAPLFPIAYLAALSGVGTRRMGEWLKHTRHGIAEWIYVARDPELRNFRGLVQNTAGRLVFADDWGVSVEVPFTGTKAPEVVDWYKSIPPEMIEQYESIPPAVLNNFDALSSLNPEALRTHHAFQEAKKWDGSPEGLAKDPEMYRRHVQDTLDVFGQIQVVLQEAGYKLENVQKGVFNFYPMFLRRLQYNVVGPVYGQHSTNPIPIGTVEVRDGKVELSAWNEGRKPLLPVYTATLQELVKSNHIEKS